ncbi:hypothetical protein O9992_28010 [Vibrio lentus]|nr:hypothetical protein [Vibrio lentus]
MRRVSRVLLYLATSQSRCKSTFKGCALIGWSDASGVSHFADVFHHDKDNEP